MKKGIRIIFTGGTIDSYAQHKSRSSFIPHYLESLHVHSSLPIRYTFLLKKFSPDLTEKDRQLITYFIKHVPEDRILLLHGTDKMVETANYLQTHLDRIDQTILLVGAMIPFGETVFSDAPFNLGYAIGTLTRPYLPRGVYIAMHGKWFLPFFTRKDIQHQVFYSE